MLPEAARDGRRAECYAAEATAANERLVENQTVQSVSDESERDQYNRLLRYVYVGGELVQERLGSVHILTLRQNEEISGETRGRVLGGLMSTKDEPKCCTTRALPFFYSLRS